MDKNKFFNIAAEVYKNCSDFWEEELPDELSTDFVFAGKDSLLSSIEVVSYFAEFETQLLKYNIDISFLDSINLDEENIKINSLYKIISDL